MNENDLRKKIRGRRSQALGAVGEERARIALIHAGLRMVEKINTGTRKRGNKTIYAKKVSGDFFAIAPGGRSVLVEVKYRPTRLTWSDFRAHQTHKLQEHHEYDGLSLVVWVHDEGTAVLRWPIVGFGKGKGLGIDDVMDIQYHVDQESLYTGFMYLSECAYKQLDIDKSELFDIASGRPRLEELVSLL